LHRPRWISVAWLVAPTAVMTEPHFSSRLRTMCVPPRKLNKTTAVIRQTLATSFSGKGRQANDEAVLTPRCTLTPTIALHVSITDADSTSAVRASLTHRLTNGSAMLLPLTMRVIGQAARKPPTKSTAIAAASERTITTARHRGTNLRDGASSLGSKSATTP